MRGTDKEAVENRYNVRITQKVQRVGDEEAVEISRYKCNEVYRYKTKPGELSTLYERVVNKDTVENRNNVNFTQGVAEEAVKNINERHGGD
jgi:hypothetical protein